MKLGSQFYSIRTECETPEALRNSFKVTKEQGYDIVQISAVCPIEAERLKSFIDEFSLPVPLTHQNLEAITTRTDELIAYHKVIGAETIGLGAMPKAYRASLEAFREAKRILAEPIKKITDAGLRFAYHNHAFDFIAADGVKFYDFLFDEIPDADFIPDVYWMKYADEDALAWLEKLFRANRVKNVHFKDMKTEPQGEICACGDGITDFVPMAKLCKKYGVENIYVEQDNAPETGSPFAEMKRSYDFLDKIVHI